MKMSLILGTILVFLSFGLGCGVASSHETQSAQGEQLVKLGETKDYPLLATLPSELVGKVEVRYNSSITESRYNKFSEERFVKCELNIIFKNLSKEIIVIGYRALLKDKQGNIFLEGAIEETHPIKPGAAEMYGLGVQFGKNQIPFNKMRPSPDINPAELVYELEIIGYY